MKNKKIHKIKSAGFTTPHDYFNSFDEKILSKVHNENQLDLIKETGFKVPDEYFESFSNSLFEKSIDQKEPKVFQLFSKRNLVYISSIAAAILLLFNLSNFESKPTFDKIETQSVENYIFDENISTYEIVALLSDENLEEDIIINYSINEENIEEYLLNNANLEALMIE